jgi:hypothetical protein
LFLLRILTNGSLERGSGPSFLEEQGGIEPAVGDHLGKKPCPELLSQLSPFFR